METTLADQALDKLSKHTGIKGVFIPITNRKTDIDGKVTLRFENQIQIERNVEVKKEIRKHHIPQLQQMARENAPFLLIADRLSPTIKQMLHEAGIDWLDGAGNIHFKDQNYFLWIDHHKTTPGKKVKGRAFTKTGLKVVFLFLVDKEWVNKTHREIAEMADVALGNIKIVIDGLKEYGFLIKEDDKKYILKDEKRLLDQWISAFIDELQPKIHTGTFSYLDEKDRNNWKKLKLTEGTVWGGEPGGDLLTGNLKPAKFTLYTNNTRAEIMKDYKLKPNPEGEIEVYKPYWRVDPKYPNIAPPLTIYIDLMVTGDPRNANIAQELYEKYIAD
ncbi:MAG: type IV toxin-antitoxin system AbiEi family antitoxin [Balneolales bacterium]